VNITERALTLRAVVSGTPADVTMAITNSGGPVSSPVLTAGTTSQTLYLAPGSYTVTPSATGYSSSPANATVDLSTADGTTPTFTLTQLASLTVSVTFGDGTAVSGAKVSLGGSPPDKTTTGTGTVTFTSLAPGTYTITTTASDNTAASPATTSIVVRAGDSLSQTVVIPVTVPGAVTGATSTGKTQTTADLSWTAASNGGATALTYTVTWSGGSTTGISGTTAHITGLTANTAYTFSVTAVNFRGSGTAGTVNVTTDP
jgi:hypothetical protein